METIATKCTIEQLRAKDIAPVTTVATALNQVETEHDVASLDYEHIEAEFARYEAEAAAIQRRMDALKEKRESLRVRERAIAIPEILARIAALGITPEDLGFAAKVSKSTGPLIHKYRNPETNDTHSGKGSLPGWLTKETKKDSRYRNPEWTAKDEAKKNKTKSPSTAIASESFAPTDGTVTTGDDEQQASEQAHTETDSNTELGSAAVISSHVDLLRTELTTDAEQPV